MGYDVPPQFSKLLDQVKRLSRRGFQNLRKNTFRSLSRNIKLFLKIVHRDHRYISIYAGDFERVVRAPVSLCPHPRTSACPYFLDVLIFGIVDDRAQVDVSHGQLIMNGSMNVRREIWPFALVFESLRVIYRQHPYKNPYYLQTTSV